MDVTGKTTIAPLLSVMQRAIRKGDGESPTPSLQDGVRAQLVLDAVLKSLHEGGWQPVTTA